MAISCHSNTYILAHPYVFTGVNVKTVCPHCNKEFEIKKPRKSYHPGEHDPISKLKKILDYLKGQTSWVWIRRIAKETRLNPYSVSYLIEKYLINYLDILAPEDVLASSGIKMKMFKLKNPEIDVDSIIKELSMRINS
jgi:hypothetical protein